MTASSRRSRRLALLLAFPIGLLLVLNLVAAGLHQHHEGDARHPCGVCVAGHASAVAAPDAASALALAAVGEQLCGSHAATPHQTTPASRRSRAPPLG